MAKKNNGKDFLFSDDCGFINGDDEGGESYRYSDGSGYYHGADGSEGYIYSDLTFILLGTNMDLHGVPILSELIRIKIEHVNLGYFDLYSKGGKLRRLYIPKKLREETQKWLLEEQRTTGYLFLNRFGERITTRGISQQLKNYADKYGLDSKVIYPHSFRHLYAKNFLEKYYNILYVGGGAIIMRRFGNARENAAYLEDIRLNAKGYELLATHQMNKR